MWFANWMLSNFFNSKGLFFIDSLVDLLDISTNFKGLFLNLAP